MKRTANICLVFSCIAAVSSCRGKEETPDGAIENLSFTATLDSGRTKTALQGDLSVRWTAEDAISVFGKTGANTCLDNIELFDERRKAVFSGEIESSSTYYAITPAQEDAILSTGIVTAEIPTVQTAVSGSYGTEAGLAIAKCGSDRKLSFKQVGALIGITINNSNIASVTLYSDSPMTGTARIDYNSGNPTVSITGGRQKVSLQGPFAEGGTYWFNVFPGDYSDLQILYTSTSGQIASFTNNKDLTISLARAEAADVIGITVESEDWRDPLLAGVVRTTNSTATVAWTEKSSNAGVFTHIWPKTISGSGSGKYYYGDDITHNYRARLYRDRACTQLEVEHTLNTSDKLFTSDYPTRFCFTGLQAATTYWFTVEDTDTPGLSLPAPLEVHTDAKSFNGAVAAEGSASAGDMLLYESFDKLLWGGDLTTFAAGYGVTDENFSTAAMIEDACAYGSEPYELPTLTIVKVRGNNSIAGASAKQIGLFYGSGLRSLLDELGLSGWGYTSSGAANTTTSITAVPGYLRIGANGSVIYGLAGPRLTAIPNGYSADVKVYFKAATYTTPATQYNNKDVAVSIIRGGSMSSYLITGHTVVSSKNITISGDGPEWKEYCVELSGATAKSRIHFAAADAATAPIFMLDDIRVEVTALTREGYVYNSSTGSGIEGVSVTDGFSVVQTDAEGHYSLTLNPAAEFIYLTVPAEYEIPYNAKGYPAFFKKIDSSLDLDFSLSPIIKQTDWTLLVATDVHANTSHTGSGRNYNMLLNKVLPDMKTAAVGYSNLYSVLLGDTMTASSATEWSEAYNTLAYSNSGARFFNIPGNHDWWDSSSATSPSIAQFTSLWGPTRWSFDRGDVHVVGMNNIRTSGHQMAEDRELDGTNNDYQAGFTDEEFSWLQADLEKVPKSKFVVLCVHVPFGEGSNNTKTRTRHVYFHDETLALLSEFAGCRIFSGHSHVNARYHDPDYPAVHESIHVALMGNSSYHTQTCADGSPIGYQFYSFSGAALSNAVFKPVGHNAEDYQMRVYDGNASLSGSHFGEYGYKLEKGYLVANVFFFNRTAEESGIKIELWQDGVKCCDMDRNAAVAKNYTNNYIPVLGAQGETVSVVLNRDWWLWNQLCETAAGKLNKNGNAFQSKYNDTTGAWLSTGDHIYRGKLNTVPANIADANFEVRVTDAYGNVYSCTELTPMDGAASNLVFWP